MLYLLEESLRLYVQGVLSSRGLESWLVSHLQAILDSGDAPAIKLANEVDADLVELVEGLLTEDAFRDQVPDHLLQLNTVVGTSGLAARPTVTIGGASAQTIRHRVDNVGRGETLRLAIQFV